MICYEHLEGRDISAALLSIATSAGQTAKPNHCSFQANRTNHFLTTKHFGLAQIVWILSIKTALNWYKPGKPGQVPPGQTRLTLLTCFKGGTLHPRRDVIDTAQGKSSLGSCHVNSMVSPNKNCCVDEKGHHIPKIYQKYNWI